MPYIFTPPQQVEITIQNNQAPAVGQPGTFSPMYGYIAEVLKTPQAGIRPDTDPFVLGSRLWFTGAFYANGGAGAPSRLIREYTQTQGILHSGQPFAIGVGPIGYNDVCGSGARVFYHPSRSGAWANAEYDFSFSGRTGNPKFRS